MKPEPDHECTSILVPGAIPFRHTPGCACDVDPAPLPPRPPSFTQRDPNPPALPEDPERRWCAIAREAAGVLVYLSDKPYAYPAEGQLWEHFARGQLAEVAAAALWELIEGAMDSDDEQHLEAFVLSLTGPGRLPEAAAAAIGPVVADLIPPIVSAIEDARKTERSES